MVTRAEIPRYLPPSYPLQALSREGSPSPIFPHQEVAPVLARESAIVEPNGTGTSHPTSTGDSMDDTTHALLASWGNFYQVTGAAAAALTGLQFIVQTLLA